MDTVSIGVTPRAFSMSRYSINAALKFAGSSCSTSETVETEHLHLVQSIGVGPVILDDVDVVGSGQQPSERGSLRVPQRGGDNSCGTSVSLSSRNDGGWTIVSGFEHSPFWSKMLRLFFTRRVVSKTMSLKLSGRTS